MRREYNIPKGGDHQVGDIAYWASNKINFIPYGSWSSSLGTPLAICVIPTSHALIWGDGKARFISIYGVNADGTASSSNVRITWSSSIADTPLISFTNVPVWENNRYGWGGEKNGGRISSDNFSHTQNTIDTTSYYYQQISYSPDYVLSPYETDGSFYDGFNRTLTGNNAMGDLDGQANTEVLIGSGNTYPAAYACHLYSSNGISGGKWYLPTLGEMGYLMTRYKLLSNALNTVGGVSLLRDAYWTSTEGSDTRNAYIIDGWDGNCGQLIKTANYYVRPFCKLN